MTPEEKQSGIPCVLVGTDGNIYALLGRARQKQSGIPCVLVGTDGNIYALLGRARQALRRGGRLDLVEPMTKEVLGSKSDELIL